MAARKSKRGAARAKPASKLPKGFTAISRGGDSWPNDDTKTGEVLEGNIVEYKTIPTKYNKKPERENVAVVERADGTKVTVWESSVLEPLFDEDYTDCAVWLRFDGLSAKKKKGQNPAKLFTIGIQE